MRFDGIRAKLIITGLFIFSWSGISLAIPLVDTGSSPYVGLPHPGLGLANYQFVAGRFTTTEDFELTELSAFVRYFGCCDAMTNPLSLSIASGPDALSGSQLTNLFTLATSITLGSGEADWATVAVDNYLLTAGTWWIVASVQPDQLSFGLGMPPGVENPMDAYASYNNMTGEWTDQGPTLGGTILPGTYGFRVEGNSLAVPEPGPLSLLVLGVACAFLHRRRVRG